MATVPPFNNPPQPPGPQTQAQDLSGYLDQWEQLTDSATKFHNSLLDQVKAIKSAREETKNIYDLQDQLNKLLKKEEDIAKAKESLESKASQQAQIALDAIKDGFEARRKQGEELTKFQQLQNAINAAELSANANTVEGQQKIEELKQKAIRQEQHIFDLKNQEQTLSKILTGEYQKQNTALSDADKKIIQQYLHQQKLGEEFDEYLKNHNIDLKVQQSIIDAQKAQMSSWQKITQYLDYIKDKYDNLIKNSYVFKSIHDGVANITSKIGLNFSKILNNVLALDKTLTEFGKSIQISKEGARTLADNFQETSYEASEINKNVSSTQASIKNQIEANNNLNKSLGTGALFTKQTRLDQIELVKGMGLEAEVGAKIYGIDKLNRLTAHQTAVAIGDQVVNTRKSTGITLDYRKVLTDVAKISGQLAVQYKNNPILLAEAVTQAQLLGLTLEQTSKMGSSLVDDFAGSLGRELEAELLTGKALNLEQARYYALMNDSAKAAKELMDNVGGIEEFQRLNVLQQKSLAAAVGLTTDELSNALTQQEFLKGTAFETKAAFEEAAREAARTGDYTKLNAELAQAANGEELAAQASQISNQEKFQMAIEKLQETLANMVNGPFGKLIDGFANLVSNATVSKGIMATISGIIVLDLVKGIFDLGKGLVKLIKPASTLAKLDTLSAAMKTFGIGVAIAGAAALAGYVAINAIASDGGGDGGSNPSISGTGGINVPNSGANNDRNINITLKSENTVNLAGQKLSHLNTESQKQINTRRA